MLKCVPTEETRRRSMTGSTAHDLAAGCRSPRQRRREPSFFQSPICKYICFVVVLGIAQGFAALVEAQSPVQRAQHAFRSQQQADALGLVQAWQTQLNTGTARSNAKVSMFVSRTKQRNVYEVVEGKDRTRYSGPTAAKDADIRHRTLLMIGRDAQLEIRKVPVISLYSQSSSGRLEAVDAESGQIRWSVRIGRPGDPAYTPAANDDYVIAISGATLVAIAADTGKLVMERKLKGVANVGPVLTGTSAIVSTQTGDFHVYSLADGERNLHPAGMMTFGRILARPRVFPGGIAWATDRGMFGGDSETLRSRFRISCSGKMIGSPAYAPPGRLAITMTDGYVLAVDSDDGRMLWEFAAGEPLDSPTYSTREAFFAASVDRNLFAIDAETGSQKWMAPDAKRVLCHDRDRIYASAPHRRLVALDAQTGAFHGHLTLGAEVRVLPNHETDRIYLLGPTGRLRCLRRATAEWPTIHAEEASRQPGALKPDGKARVQDTPPARASAPASTSASPDPGDESSDDETDPFAAGDESDPFATGDESDPFTTGDDSDPFR